MKALFIECTIFRFKSSNKVNNIDVEDPSNKGVEAFEINLSINTSKFLGFFGITMSILSSKFGPSSGASCSSCACRMSSYLAKASFTSMWI
jgi:hypothetical protein